MEINSYNKITNKNIDKKRFKEALNKVIGVEKKLNGIGTLKEKTVHSVMKYYYEPDSDFHEVKIGSYVADICVGKNIYEIQTRSFNAMRGKLDYFLKEYDVTVIYPVPHIKWISWLDMDTGELTPKRKSPKKGTIYQIIPELYKIKMFMNNPKLHFIIPLIDVEETRYLNGWSDNKKRGSSRMDGIPIDIYDEIRINTMADYAKFLPDDLPKEFTTKDFAKCAHIQQKYAVTGLNVLLETGIVERTGKIKNSYIYKKAPNLVY